MDKIESRKVSKKVHDTWDARAKEIAALVEKEDFTNPTSLDGFTCKDYCGKAALSLDVKDGEREFVAKITIDTRDRDNEIIDPAGIDYKAYRKNPIILWSHNYTEPPIGKALWIKKWSDRDSGGHIAKGRIAKTAKGDEILSLMQQGILNTVSIGFIPIASHNPTDDEIKKNPKLKGVHRVHDKISVVEFSIVNVPSNPEATIEAVSKGVLAMSIEMQKELNIHTPINTPLRPTINALPYKATPFDGIESGWMQDAEMGSEVSSEDLFNMAAWMDSENKEARDAYKFIHHRPSNGYPVVYEALKLAMQDLQTRAVTIPEHDRRLVYDHLADHYRKEFNRTPPPFMAEAEAFTLATDIEVRSIKNMEIIETHKPIEMKAVENQEVIKTKKVIDRNKLTEDVRESFEVNVLGRV